ncbi:MAG: hypothetical protein GY817_03140 [bacterium]|nr:hypothetical protein [bacterium]
MSFILCVAFLTVTMHNFAYANENLPTLRSTNLILPDLAGNIVEVFQGQSSKNIYLINDLHCDYTVQSNIAESLGAITDQHPQGLVIGVEGNSGWLDTQRFSSIPKGNLKNKIMDKLLSQGIITGWEKYADSQEEALVYGVENNNLYQANFKQLYQNINYYDFMLELATKVKKIMQSGSEVLYPDHLRYLETQRLLYESGVLSFEDWVSILLKAKDQEKLKFHTPNLELIQKMTHLKQNLNFELVYLEVHDFIKSLLPHLQKAEKDSLKKLKAQVIA